MNSYYQGLQKKFLKNLKKIKKFNIGNLKKDLSNIKEVFLSSGVENEFEMRYLNLFKKKKIKTITFIDHWAYYKERFKYKRNIYSQMKYGHQINTHFKKQKKFSILKLNLSKTFF